MFCFNCGAKVDDSSKFCPVCGNKLDKDHLNSDTSQNADNTIIEKSTYESLNTNQNLIEDKENNQEIKKESKTNKFMEIFSSFKNKNNDKAKKVQEEIEVPDGQSELRQQEADESLEHRLEFEEEIPSAYYGYNPTDDRKNREKRRLSTGQTYQEETDSQVISQRTFESSANEGQEFENDLSYDQLSSVESRIRDKFNKAERSDINQQSPNLSDDISSEYVEARIANLLKKNTEDSNKKAASSGNIAALLRSHQPKTYDSYQPKTDEKDNKQVFVSSSEPGQGTYQAVNAQNEEVVKSADEPIEKKEKEGFNFKPIYILPILLLALAIGLGYLFMNRKPKDVELDLSNYIDVTYTGDNASASPSASLDTNKLLNDFGSQIKYVNKKRKSDNYGSAANQFVEELANATTFQFSKDSNLSNGEEITVVANVSDPTIADDYNVLFANTIKSVIVDGLNVEASTDPFNYIDVNFQGEDPNISLTTSLTEDAPEYMSQVEIMPSKTSELKAGEEVNITINLNEEEIYNNYKVKLSPLDRTYTVPGEPSGDNEGENKEDENKTASPELKDGFIGSVDNLEENLLNELKTNAENLIKETFNERSFTQISSVNYLGSITGTDANSDNLKNRVMLVYEIKAKEDYEGKYQNEFTYYSFVEYQNVKDKKDDNGAFYSEGPLTTDNEIFHKFFVSDDYTYYEIPYYGFGFLEEVIARVNNSLSGLTIDDSIAVDQSQYFTKTDGIANEYQGNGTRLSLREDGSLKYQKDNRVHQGSWQENGNDITLTIQGVNVDTPINAKFENGSINVSEQGEMGGQTFNKMQAF